MKFVGFVLLFVVAAAMVIGMIVGVALEILWFGFLALLVVGGVSWVMGKIKGKRAAKLEHPLDAERLPR
jgi:hypothetical protein